MNKRIISIATALLIAFSLMPATAQNGTGYDPRADYHFNQSITSGVGTHRTVGWFFYPSRFTGAAREAMQRDCRVEFGVCRLQFRFDGREYPREGIENPN